MKPNPDKNKKLNLNKQTIQKLDSKKLANVFAAGYGLPTNITNISITTTESYVCEPLQQLSAA